MHRFNLVQPKTTHIHEFINYRCSYLSDLGRSVCLCMCAPTCALEAFIVYHSVQCCGDLWASYQSFWVNRKAPQIQFLRDKQVQVSVFPPYKCDCVYVCIYLCIPLFSSPRALPFSFLISPPCLYSFIKQTGTLPLLYLFSHWSEKLHCWSSRERGRQRGRQWENEKQGGGRGARGITLH